MLREQKRLVTQRGKRNYVCQRQLKYTQDISRESGGVGTWEVTAVFQGTALLLKDCDNLQFRKDEESTNGAFLSFQNLWR